MATDSEVSLTGNQRSELSSIAQSRTLPAGYVFRAKLILMLAEGASFNTIKRRLQTSAPTIIRWKQRFLESGLDGLDTYHPGQKATVLTPALRARILSATRKKPSDGSTHWSCRKLATALGVSKDAVHRVWKEAGLNPIAWNVTWPATIRSSKAKQPTLSACICGLRSMPPCSASMRKPPFKPWIASIPCCRFRRDEPSVTASSTIGMERFLSMPRWTPRLAACTEKPRPATPAVTSLPSSQKWYRCVRPGSRFISSSTISPPTKPSSFATSCNSILACSFTSPLRIPLGSTKSSSGSPRSNVRSLPAASSPLYLTWLANSVVTSTPTLPTLARSSGNTPTLLGAYVLTNSLRQATSRS